MPTKYEKTETRLAAAVLHAQAVEEPIISAIAKEFDVSRFTLSRRLSGRLSRSERPPTNRKMTPEMEKALLRFCTTLEQMGVAARVDHLRKAALSMFGTGTGGDDDEVDVTLGAHWTERFIQRNNLFTVHQKSREAARVIATDRDTMWKYFQEFKKTRDEYGILVN